METVPLKSAMNVRDFPISSIRFLQELGEGQFGKVFKGYFLHPLLFAFYVADTDKL
jgi:hypothetical protein